MIYYSLWWQSIDTAAQTSWKLSWLKSSHTTVKYILAFTGWTCLLLHHIILELRDRNQKPLCPLQQWQAGCVNYVCGCLTHTHHAYSPLASLVQAWRGAADTGFWCILCVQAMSLLLMRHAGSHEATTTSALSSSGMCGGSAAPFRLAELFVRWGLRRVRGTHLEPAAGGKAKL